MNSNHISPALLIGILIFSSCVPNKKILYLQTKDELKTDFPTDTVLREYKMGNYEYRIQPEDVLSIQIESLTDEEFDIFANQQNQFVGGGAGILALAGYLVRSDGKIALPQLGNIRVEGHTVHEIENAIKKLASNYLDDPTVKVRILNLRISILGEVNIEGIVNSFNNRVTLMEAIASAGGLTDLADRSAVKIIRQEGNTARVIYANLLGEDLLSQNDFFIHPNDIVLVPPLRQRPFRTYFGPNLSLLISSISVLLLTINLINN